MNKICMVLVNSLLFIDNISAMDDSREFLSVQKRIEELYQELNELNQFDMGNQQRDEHETAIMDEIYNLHKQIGEYRQAKKQVKK